MVYLWVAILRYANEETDLRLLFEYLAERLHEPDWAVGLKTFYLLHTLMLDSNRPAEYLQQDARWFDYALRLYSGTQQQHPRHVYVQFYSEYIRTVAIQYGGFYQLELMDLDASRSQRQEQVESMLHVSGMILETKIYLDDLGDDIIRQFYRALTMDLISFYPLITKLMLSLLRK